ncbi:MAG: alpha-glucosidase [Candidatus Izemoplasmatales bacterium]|nr:alpha-glucosidase [Candidatus Izemoplasmatales bacterium]
MKWWQTENIYQIYLRSFQDSNQDGIGDLQGIRQRLPYLHDLGIGVIWISPHYDSPMDDNGYDVRNFYEVSKDYGNLDDFRLLVEEAHQRNIRVITDLVLNHTSDEHPWFLAAKNPMHPDHQKYHDYYIWQPPKYNDQGQKIPPTRWIGWFGSPAWEWNEATGEYYLHIFSRKMPDLNWRNAPLREDMKQMIHFWLDLGIDGFRVDASNHLEKNWDFPDAFPGYENFSSLPKHHEYLQELGKEIFVPREAMTIGESGGATKEEALQYAGYGSNEFNMLIQFGHCWADINPHHPQLMGKWAQGKLSVSSIKHSFHHWYQMMGQKGWNVIYWHNHDQPRVLSHYGNDSIYREASAKMLAYALYYMRGTSITYQGEEIGMSNVDYVKLEQFRDVEVFTEYQNFLSRGLSHEEAMEVLRARARDNARSPMQWDSSAYSGFSTVEPWIDVNGNYPTVNVALQQGDPDSVLSTYQRILQYRRQNLNILDGEVLFLDLENEDTYCYVNLGKEMDHLVLCNFRNEEKTVDLSKVDLSGFELLETNLKTSLELTPKVVLAPFQGVVFCKKKR